ncbi:MAG: DUF2304 family protein, partial [bacterium]|nr:DUF2304 family protein [bacterium]
AVAKLRQKTFTTPVFTVWVFLWFAMGIVVWYPNISDTVANILQVGRGTDAILYISLIVIFYLLFRISARMEKTHHDVTKLARAIAIASKKEKQ